MRRLSERSSTEDDSMWEMVDADQSPEEPPLQLQVRPITQVSTSEGGKSSAQQPVDAGRGTGVRDTYGYDDDIEDDEWEEIHPDQFSGPSQVWNYL